MNFKVYIPARFDASRLPGKPLLVLAGKPLLQHVYERAKESGAREVVIATDNEKILRCAESFGASVCMTADSHNSGTDRIAEAIDIRDEADEQIIVNLQGDEPQLPGDVIRQVAACLSRSPPVQMATVCEPIESTEQLFDANIVKVVRADNDTAAYFSRAPIPWDRETFTMNTINEAQRIDLRGYRRHVGIYAYRARFLREFVTWPQATLEIREKLEQLRALANGALIAVPDACLPCGRGIDTPADLELARSQWNKN